jgi:cytochrome P450
MINTKVLQRSARALPPGPHGYPLVGILPQVLRNPLDTLTNAARQYGGVVHLGSYRPGRHVILISHPGPLKHVLQERYRSYERSFVEARTGLLLGKSLPLLKGESWFQRRRLLQPVFHTKHIAKFASTMTDKTAAMVEQWRAPATRGEVLDIAFEMSRITRDIIVKIMFGLDLAIDSDETTEIERSLRIAVAYTNYLTFTNPLPLWVPTPRNRAFRQALQTFDRIVYRIIDERRRSVVEQRDLMSLLLEAHDQDTGEGMSDQELRDEVITVFLTGHETTGNALAWTWYLLSLHPVVERRLHAEVDEVLDGRLPVIDDIPRLVYTRMVVMESLRLFPTAWLDSRALQSDEKDEIDGHMIDKKTLIFYSPYVTHRLPELWENPDAFDPERFAPEPMAKLPQFIYIPFGGGPRQCIGNNLALIESQLILATVAQRYSLRLVPGTRVEPQPTVALRPRNGLPMKLLIRGCGRSV